METLGINIGSTSVKTVMLKDGKIVSKKVIPHEGNFQNTLINILVSENIPEGIQTIGTGTEGVKLLKTPNIIESLCIEAALKWTGRKTDAIISMGGEDLIVYTIDETGKIITSFSGNKCASGTGEFFRQQLGRMNMKLEDINKVSPTAKALKLSSRCSVFMKSDCTHKLNKGEATGEDIVLSLSQVMAGKIMDFLDRARITKGIVMLVGGVAQNKHILKFIKETAPEIDFVVPEEAPYFEALGAAILAEKEGGKLPDQKSLFTTAQVHFGRFKSLKTVLDKVSYIPSKKGKAKPGKEYILGVDGGSTTTKVALIDIETEEVVASYYGRTHGDPVKALKNCLVEVKKQLKEQIGDEKVKISIAATTGSSREILGVFLETGAIYNEIIAHAVGTTYFNSEIDTVFEIGGQDAKYIHLKNKVPIDYAMNEACSAGTGSFLEESAHGDLNIEKVEDIADIALNAEAPLKFGEHCSAFINSDIRKAIQQGASREDITAGIVTSIVANYLNRVVGNRTIGNKIVLQGGVAKNKAVPLAFALLMGKEIVIPPDPELMGCFGVGILAKQKEADGFIDKSEFDIDKILNTEIIYKNDFRCEACDNFCSIRILEINGHRYMFGGRCNKYANLRKKKAPDQNEVFDYIEVRNNLMFNEFAPKKETLVKKKELVVGIPKAFSVYNLYPFYAWFFHALGVETILSKDIQQEGIAKSESAYCHRAEIAHGAVHELNEMKVDYIFLPHFKDMPSYEEGIHATICPIVQAFPYYIRQAFPEVDVNKFLAPVITFYTGKKKTLESFTAMGETLGFSAKEVEDAFEIAYEKQREFYLKTQEVGKEALERARKANHPVIAVLGRPYNALTPDANMGIPKKYTSRGYSVIPFDILPITDEEIFKNMYWFYGQQNLKAASMIKKEDNIFITFISNFSCAPDSFILHYIKWIMGIKPFLVLELDSHTADAGIDTRVEAFLDIIEGYRSKIGDMKMEQYDNGLRFVNNGKDPIHILNRNTSEKVPIKHNPKVKILFSSMGKISSDILASVVRSVGINAEGLPIPDTYTLQIARSHASGKECLPSHLVLGSALKYFTSPDYKKDEIYLLFVPTTQGPCRTGQFAVFYENLFKDMRIPNVVLLTLDSENSYNELGMSFSKYAWWGLLTADYMKDIHTTLMACAEDPKDAEKQFYELWNDMTEIADKDITKVVPLLKKMAKKFKKIKLKRDPKDSPKVLIVGEIYVRRDDFAVDDLVNKMSEKGIIGKVSGITEWVHYTDFARHYQIKRKMGLKPFWKRLFCKERKDLIFFHLEKFYKNWVESRIKKALKPSGLLIKAPHDMPAMMKNAEKEFISHELESEIVVSAGVAAEAMAEDYSGVVNIAPFACLIGRGIEGILGPWSRGKRYPFISVEIDGNPLPINLINKLDIFMLNVQRYREDERKK